MGCFERTASKHVLSVVKQITSPGALDKCSGLVHWEDSEGLGREGGGRGDWDGEYM